MPKAPPPTLFLYHKPKGVIVTRRDAKDKNRRTIADELADLGRDFTSSLWLLVIDGPILTHYS